LEQVLKLLRTDYIDVFTFYYVEELAEWRQMIGSGGALEYCTAAQREGRVRMLGVTSHQRRLAAEMATSGLLDLLMIRYNAAHRGAEHEVFPLTSERGMPVVVYTCLRWGALLRSMANDPPGFTVPPAPAWYRFALQHPAVTVALMAPKNRAELDEDLLVLQLPQTLSPEEYDVLAAHGQRVRRNAGSFP
jgi:predicted aldo/keto reductase-like oxidoreductase